MGMLGESASRVYFPDASFEQDRLKGLKTNRGRVCAVWCWHSGLCEVSRPELSFLSRVASVRSRQLRVPSSIRIVSSTAILQNYL
eukprot:4152818-Pleurochrysis_carterae.AAC.1